jgi:hypothetical protein
MRPPGILSDRECFAGMGGIEENAAQPRRIAPFETECLAEYPGFMPTARVYQAQAIILDLADIENGLIAARKASRHRGRLASRRFGRKRRAIQFLRDDGQISLRFSRKPPGSWGFRLQNGLRRQINFVSWFKLIPPVRPPSAKIVLPFFRKI